jgi:GTP diphosphokinase / guanosine-3',5'-bis(diphosphate) 3'-diphosphatase
MGENRETASVALNTWCILVFSMSWDDFSPSVRHLSARDRTRVKSAYELGFKVHDGQKRKSGEPFFSHPITVAKILSDWGADTDTLIAALLHDSVEDTPLTIDEVETTYGHGVAILIEGVTKLTAEEVAQRPTLNESTETLRKMFRLMEQDVRIIVIKLADRLHNMQTIASLKPDRQQAIAQETLDVYVRVAEQLSMQDLRVQLEDLSLAVTDPDGHRELAALREENEKLGSKMMDTLRKALKSSPFSSPSIKFLYEHKTWEKLREQAETSGATATGIPNVIVAIVCKSVPDCYYMLGTLHQLWQREALSFQDYINSPLLNGYRGLHTTIILEDGTRIRCKIRTEEMHEYTKRGITTMCFDNRVEGFDNYLEWTRRISPLVEDTKERSDEFLKSLQRDILGDSITVHGPANQTMQLPKQSSVLDGVCYFYGHQAIYVREITLDGKPVSFYADLTNAATLRAVFDSKPQVHLSWLQYVRTGIALAIIRGELAKQPTAEKKEIGRTLVENAMRKRGTIGLNELNPDAISGQLTALGVSSLADLYEHVAEGKIDPESVVQIFSPSHKGARKQWTLHIEHDGILSEDVFKTLRSLFCLSLNVKQYGAGVSVRAQYLIDSRQAQELESALKNRLPQDDWRLVETGKTRRIWVAVIALVMLWGLDPVFGRFLLKGPISPYDLTFLRFFTFFLAATIAYASQGYLTQRKFKPLNPLQPSLLLSGLSLFVTAFFSYLALNELPASQYILLIVLGLLLLSYLRLAIRNGRPDGYLTLTLLTLLGGVGVLSYMQGSTPFGIAAGVVSSLGFALYSQVSRRYQEEEAFIRARYPAFMFWVASIGFIASLPLIPSLSILALSAEDLARAVVFILVFSVLPYVLYFECMRRTESRVLDRTLPFVTISTFLGEALFSGSLIPLIAVPLILLFWHRED